MPFFLWTPKCHVNCSLGVCISLSWLEPFMIPNAITNLVLVLCNKISTAPRVHCNEFYTVTAQCFSSMYRLCMYNMNSYYICDLLLSNSIARSISGPRLYPLSFFLYSCKLCLFCKWMLFRSHASNKGVTRLLGSTPSCVLVFRTPSDNRRCRGSGGRCERTATTSCSATWGNTASTIGTDIWTSSSSYNFLCGTLSGGLGDILENTAWAERNGEGEQDFGCCGVRFGGLSTTPSSTGLSEKSIVELAVAAEHRKFPVLRIAFWPYSKKESSEASQVRLPFLIGDDHEVKA